MFSQLADGFGLLENTTDLYNNNTFDNSFQDLDDFGIFDQDEKQQPQGGVETISPILTVAIPPFGGAELRDETDPFMSSISSSSYSLDIVSEPQLSPPSSLLSNEVESVPQLGPDTGGGGGGDGGGGPAVEGSAQRANYIRQPRQGRYSKSRSSSVSSSSSSPDSHQRNRHSQPQRSSCEHKKVSDSRLSAQGLAKVLNLDSPEEALKRERYILDIFENELHYPLGYKTWVRDTFKDKRIKLIDQLHERVKHRYPEYDHSVLETIIRRATYYMMQSRLRRERRARAKGIKFSRSNASSPTI